MALELSTAGVSISFAIEADEGERPESGYQKIPNIKSSPDMNPEPSNLDVTDFYDKEYKRYINGLKSPDGVLAFRANNTKEFQAAWVSMCNLSALGAEEGLSTWFCVEIPGLDNAFYFSAIPSVLGVQGMNTDEVAEVDAYLTPNLVDGWKTVPEDPAVYITPVPEVELTASNSPLDISILTDVTVGIDTVESDDTSIATVTKGTGKITVTRQSVGKTIVIVTTASTSTRSAGRLAITINCI